MLEKAVTAADIADELGVTAETIRVYARTGEIPALRLGGMWRFYPSEVREALKPNNDLWAQPAASLIARRQR